MPKKQYKPEEIVTKCSGLSNHVVNTTCCSSHSQLTHSASCRYFTSRDTGSVANTKRYVTADNGFSGPLPVAA